MGTKAVLLTGTWLQSGNLQTREVWQGVMARVVLGTLSEAVLHRGWSPGHPRPTTDPQGLGILLRAGQAGPAAPRVSEPGMDPLTRRLVVRGVAFEGEPVSCEFLATASHISFQPSCCPDIDQFPMQVATRPWVGAEDSVQWGAREQAGTGPARPGWVFSALSPWSPPARQLTAWEQNSPSSMPSLRPTEPTPSPLMALGADPPHPSWHLIV